MVGRRKEVEFLSKNQLTITDILGITKAPFLLHYLLRKQKIQLFVLNLFSSSTAWYWLPISRFVRDVLTFNLCTAKNQFILDRKIGFGRIVEIINTSIFPCRWRSL